MTRLSRPVLTSPIQHQQLGRMRSNETDPSPDDVPGGAAIDLYWLPLGAGGHSVRWNGRIFEWVVALIQRRDRCDLYHSALEVQVPEARFVIEQAPAWRDSSERGVVAEGAVGSRAAGRLRLLRYEVRCWRDGTIPDIAEAVDSPQRLSHDPGAARQLLALAPQVPAAVWARDEQRAGEMWNSNSVISWLLTLGGLDVDSIRPPVGGRAPGWRAGIVVARREQAATRTAWTAPANRGQGSRTVERAPALSVEIAGQREQTLRRKEERWP